MSKLILSLKELDTEELTTLIDSLAESATECQKELDFPYTSKEDKEYAQHKLKRIAALGRKLMDIKYATNAQVS